MKKSRIPMGLLIIGITVSFPVYSAWAETFNISNPAELVNVLTTAASNHEDDVIHIAPGTYPVSTLLTYYSEDNNSLTLDGAGKGSTVFDGAKSCRILSISTGQTEASVLIQNISFQNAATSGSGGALEIFTESASITLNNCRITDSAATGNDSIGGGASLNSNTGTVTVSSCEFLRNSSTGNVGGLYAATNTGALNLINCTFEGNSVNNTGGSDYWGGRRRSLVLFGRESSRDRSRKCISQQHR
jgi:hypothetical protein